VKISVFPALFGVVLISSCSLTQDPGSYSSGICPADQKECSKTCVSVNDVTHGCGDRNTCQPCDLLGANAKCVAGTCVVESCLSGNLDCNADPTDGCEIDTTSDPLNCGFCDHVCTVASATATPTCQASLCSATCRQGYADCKGMPHACETHVEADDANCGSCNMVCPKNSTCIANQCTASTGAR
jgi:hypothetical protein